MEKRDQILHLLQTHCRMDYADMAQALNMAEDDLRSEIERMEKENIIMGYSAMVDWDKASAETVRALIEVSTTPQRDRGFGSIARRIYNYPEVQDCYLVSGGFDLMVVVVTKDLKSVSRFVSEKIAPLEGVTSTRTHFILQNYKVNGITFDVSDADDRETVVI